MGLVSLVEWLRCGCRWRIPSFLPLTSRHICLEQETPFPAHFIPDLRAYSYPHPQRKQSEFTVRGGALRPSPLSLGLSSPPPPLLIWAFALDLSGRSQIQQELSQRELFLGTSHLSPP